MSPSWVRVGGGRRRGARRAHRRAAGRDPALLRGALATSGTTKRRWMRGGRVHHHLIDAANGTPGGRRLGAGDGARVTCLAADAAAKAGFLLGEEGPAWLDARSDPRAVPRPGGRRSDGQPRLDSNRGAGVHLTSSPLDWYAARGGGGGRLRAAARWW